GSEEWPEVQYINGHAVFKQYLTRVVTGLGVLIFTWSTVVLLGGFVSLLDNRDFWLLTLITLCQTQEASGAITGGVVEGFSGVTRLLGTEYTTANKPPAEPAPAAAGAAAPAKHATKAPMKLDQLARRVRARAMFVARATLILFRFLVFTTIVVPLVIVYTLGMYISTAISLYRLTQPDLGVGSAAAGDGTAGANLQKPALRVLYVMALVQGVLYFYGLTFTSTGRKMERKVADSYELASGKDSAVRSYAEATMDGCTKDLSFAKGRNMVTYAMGLVESASTDTDDFASGVTILNALIRLQLRAQQALMRQLLIGSASSAHILGKLFEAASRSPAEEGGGGLRELAAAIVEHFAVDIRLSKVPGGIECVSSMLELSTVTPELDQRKHTLHQSLRILRMLAGHNDNCRVISNAEGLLSGVMAPVNSDLLHRVGHEAWRPVVEESMELAARFVAAPGVAGVRLRRGISSNEEAVAAMGSILECNECQPPLQHVAIKILTQLAMDASSSTSAGSRERLARSMMRVFFDDGKASSSVVRKRRAAQALAMLSAQSQSIAAIILHANGNAIAALKHTILHSEDNEIRVSAVEILTHLRDHYTNDDEHLAELKKAIKDLMPEV
uniref:Uncharacterized protein n=1 Tax=Oryza brachyantha TaxID=4533 RepID=J3NE11_ORYBR